jgi:hypothetical protein
VNGLVVMGMIVMSEEATALDRLCEMRATKSAGRKEAEASLSAVIRETIK